MADKTIPDFVFPSGSEKPDMSRDDLAAVAEAVAALFPEDKSYRRRSRRPPTD